jgi:hypothetical protein
MDKVEKVKDNTVKKLKKKHEEQKKVVNELTKNGKDKAVSKKLLTWKKESEKVPEVQKVLSESDKKIKNRLSRQSKKMKKGFLKKYYSGLRKGKFRIG